MLQLKPHLCSAFANGALTARGLRGCAHLESQILSCSAVPTGKAGGDAAQRKWTLVCAAQTCSALGAPCLG